MRVFFSVTRKGIIMRRGFPSLQSAQERGHGPPQDARERELRPDRCCPDEPLGSGACTNPGCRLWRHLVSLTKNPGCMLQDTPEELGAEAAPEELLHERGGPPPGTPGSGASQGGRREAEAQKGGGAGRRVHGKVGWQLVSAAALRTMSAALLALASSRQSGSGAWPARSIMLVPRSLPHLGTSVLWRRLCDGGCVNGADCGCMVAEEDGSD